MIGNFSDFEVHSMNLVTTWKSKNVNSKKLFKDVHTSIYGFLTEDASIWLHDTTRTQLIWLIDEYLADMAENGLITQYNVVSDGRNNHPSDVEQNLYHVDVSYVQKYCLNTTKIRYDLRVVETVY